MGVDKTEQKKPFKNFCGGRFEKRILERIFARFRTQGVSVVDLNSTP